MINDSSNSFSLVPDPVLLTPGLTALVRDQIEARQYRQRKAEHLLRFLNDSYFLRRSHKNSLRGGFPAEVSTLDRFTYGVPISAHDLKQGLGGSTGNYKKYVNQFWYFNHENAGYDREAGETKLYVLRPETTAMLDDYWRVSCDAQVVDRDTGRPLAPEALPDNGIIRTSFCEIKIRPLVRFDSGRLNEAIRSEESVVRDGSHLFVGYRRRRRKTLRELFLIQQWNSTFGGLPNLYADFRTEPQSGNGRLFGVGEINLQTLRRATRNHLYAGTGWWDFDFAACHWNLLLSLCRGLRVEACAVEAYVTDIRAADKRLAHDLEIPDGKAKRAMLATLYGARVGLSERNALCRCLGRPGVRALRQHPAYMRLRAELELIAVPIIAAHTDGEYVVNAVGKRRPVLTETKHGGTRPTKSAKLLSHILTGYEAWALNHVCRNQDDIVALMHDGWVSEGGRDTRELSSSIETASRSQFGFPIRLMIKARQM